MTENFWLINSNRSRVKRFSKNNQNKDKFFEYMFIDSGRILGVLGKEPPLMTTREELKVDKTGSAEVWRGNFEQAELYHEQLFSKGLTMAPIEKT